MSSTKDYVRHCIVEMHKAVGKYEQAKANYAHWKKRVENSEVGIDHIDREAKARDDAVKECSFFSNEAQMYASVIQAMLAVWED